MSELAPPRPMGRRRALRTLLALGAAVLPAALPRVALGEVRLQLTAEPANPSAGEVFRIRYGVELRNERDPRVLPLEFGGLEVLSDPSPPQMPAMFGFGFGGGPGATISMQTASDYIVRAPAAGRYVISNARVLDPRGRVLAQHPNLVLVVGGNAAAANPTITNAGNPAPEPPRDPDAPPAGDLTGAEPNGAAFVRVALDPPRPWLGQQATLRAWLYINASEAGCEVSRELGLVGFFNELLQPPTRECATQWFRARLPNGSNMQAGLIRRMAVFPSQTGQLQITPMTVEAQLVSGGFFRSIQRVNATSPTLEVEVREPPIEGRPEGYVPGVVGPVRLEASVDHEQVAVGETVTVTVRAVSDGSLASARVTLPENLDGLRLRPGESRSVREVNTGRVVSTLSTELLVVPERAGSFALGTVRLPYWDPSTERYAEATATLPTLQARGDAVAPERNTQTDDPAMALRPLVSAPSLGGASGRWFRGRAPLGWVSALPGAALVLLGAGGARRSLRKRRTELDSTRKSDPRALLAEARRLLATDKLLALSTAARALDKSSAEVRAGLDEGLDSLPPETRELLRKARELCDGARFAGDSADVDPVVAAVGEAVGAMEQALEQ